MLQRFVPSTMHALIDLDTVWLHQNQNYLYCQVGNLITNNEFDFVFLWWIAVKNTVKEYTQEYTKLRGEEEFTKE